MPGDHRAVRNEKQLVADQKIERALAHLSRDDLLDAVLNGFQTGQGANLRDVGDRIRDDGGRGMQQFARPGSADRSLACWKGAMTCCVVR